MNSFQNRQGDNLNKKVFQVDEVQRDGTGEIVQIKGNLFRDDSEGLTQEGTPLEAETLTIIVENMVLDIIDNKNKYYFKKDLRELNVNSVITDELILPKVGNYGSQISWEVVSGSAIVLNDLAEATIYQSDVNSHVTLKATLTYMGLTDTKSFDVVVRAKEVPFLPKLYNQSWNQNRGTLQTSFFNIVSQSGDALYAEIENVYSEYLNVTIVNNSTSFIRININETSYLNNISDYSTAEFNFKIHLYLDSNRYEEIGVLPCTITYHFSSVSPDD